MTRRQRLTCAAALVAALAAAVGAARACTWWYVQAVIDWSGVEGAGDPKEPVNLHQIVAGKGWEDKKDPEWPEVEAYRLRDKDIMLPPPAPQLRENNLRILSGAVVAEKGGGVPEEMTVEWYRIWGWVDVNNNGAADENDTIGNDEQNWTCLNDITSEPPKVSPSEINKEIDVLRGGYQPLKLQAGLTYLLLIEAVVKLDDGRTRNSLECEGDVEIVGEGELKLADTHTKTRSWEDEGNLRFCRYDGKNPDGTAKPGLDDFEVLWVRVNNPPAPPGR